MAVRGDSIAEFGANDHPNWVRSVVQAGTRYRFTCWVRADAGTVSAQLRVREFLGAGRVGVSSYSPRLKLGTEWRQVVVEHTAGAAGSTLDFQILCEPKVAGARMLVDDVGIRVKAAAGSAAARAAERRALDLDVDVEPSIAPNPFRTRGTLSLSLAHRGPLRVAVFDVNGRRVRTLCDQADAEAGVHHFDLGEGMEPRAVRERLSPGMFFYRIETRGGSRVGRFVILE